MIIRKTEFLMFVLDGYFRRNSVDMKVEAYASQGLILPAKFSNAIHLHKNNMRNSIFPAHHFTRVSTSSGNQTYINKKKIKIKKKSKNTATHYLYISLIDIPATRAQTAPPVV